MKIPHQVAGRHAPPPSPPPTAAQQFMQSARNGTAIVIPRPDGSRLVNTKPHRTKDFKWHRPERHVPAEQWNPATGITRWEFERKHTPRAQAEVLSELGRRVLDSPPQLAPPELWAKVAEAEKDRAQLGNGLTGMQLPQEILEELDSYVHDAFSPDGQWRFLVQAVRFNGGIIADRLDVRHCDYRTVADWTLVCRLRSWVLEDDRSAFLYLPGQDMNATGWETVYENDTPNNLAMVAPRWTDQDTPPSSEDAPIDS
jgi:hypothetical protein